MIRRAGLLCSLLVLASTLRLHAAEPASARIQFEPPDEIWTGQQITFYVEVLTSTSFADSPHFDLPPTPGAVLLKPQMFSLTTHQTIDGTRYTVQSHQFAIYAQKAGEVVVEPIGVRFGAKADEGEPVEQHVKTELLKLEAKAPPGAENLSFPLTARGLTVNESWEPDPRDPEVAKTQVGAAFTRTFTWKAPDVMGMAFPEIPAAEIDGLAIYRREPEVEDKIFRGQITGERRESVTYVCEKAGEYTLPALVIPWFDLESKAIQRVRFDAVTLQVTGGETTATTSPEANAASPVEDGSALWPWFLGVTLVLLGVGGWLFRSQAERLRAWKEERQESEAAYFARVTQACQSGDAARALNALMRWLDRRQTGPECGTIAAFLRTQNDSKLAEELAKLQLAVVRRQSWSGSALATELEGARQRRDRRRHQPAPDLPPLNPRFDVLETR